MHFQNGPTFPAWNDNPPFLQLPVDAFLVVVVVVI
jgi:hypothetical protein